MKKFMLREWFTCVFVCLSCFLMSEKLSAEVNGVDEVRTVTLNMPECIFERDSDGDREAGRSDFFV